MEAIISLLASLALITVARSICMKNMPPTERVEQQSDKKKCNPSADYDPDARRQLTFKAQCGSFNNWLQLN
jgi:hypothetical protein